jgi:hypothetical protein
MAFFGKILEKLGFGSTAESPTTVAPSSSAPASASASPTASSAPQPVAVVDVVAQLEQRATANPQKLNWRTSIVDLLKLLDIDSSVTARKELAAELGCPADLTGDSAKMNIWVHRTVLARIAANGGNVPKKLLDEQIVNASLDRRSLRATSLQFLRASRLIRIADEFNECPGGSESVIPPHSQGWNIEKAKDEHFSRLKALRARSSS